jgi:hypothetical protein
MGTVLVFQRGLFVLTVGRFPRKMSIDASNNDVLPKSNGVLAKFIVGLAKSDGVLARSIAALTELAGVNGLDEEGREGAPVNGVCHRGSEKRPAGGGRKAKR